MYYYRSELVRRLAKKSGYFMKDIDTLFKAYDELILELMSEATEDEDVSIQVLKGVKLNCSVVPERNRVNPQTSEPIILGPTCKPHAKFSQDFKNQIQQNYDMKKGG